MASQEWYAANKDKVAEYNRKYVRANRERLKLNKALKRASGETRAKERDYYQRNRDRLNRYQRERYHETLESSRDRLRAQGVKKRYPPELVDVKIMQLKLQALVRRTP